MARFTKQRQGWVKRFRRVATHRLEEARFLLDKGRYTTGAAYLGGYAVECVLKALVIANDRPSADPDDTVQAFVASGAKSHNYDFLVNELRTRGVVLPSPILKQIGDINWWSTDLRYDPVRRTHQVVEDFLETAASIVRWVDRRV